MAVRKPSPSLRAEDIRRYLDRDWAAVREAKRRHWAHLTPAQRLDMADDLRRHVAAFADRRVLAEQRRLDLESHLRVRALLDRAARNLNAAPTQQRRRRAR